jgi:hypothetical protein
MTDELKESLERLGELASIEDSREQKEPKAELVDRTEQILRDLDENGLLGFPAIVPASDGGIDITWLSESVGGFSLYLSICPYQSAEAPEYYLLNWGFVIQHYHSASFLDENPAAVTDVLIGLLTMYRKCLR